METPRRTFLKSAALAISSSALASTVTGDTGTELPASKSDTLDSTDSGWRQPGFGSGDTWYNPRGAYPTTLQTKWTYSSEDRAIHDPVTADGSVYGVGKRTGAMEPHLHAVDAETGMQQWHTEVNDDVRNPFVVGQAVYCVDDSGIWSFSTDDGSERWHHDDSGVILVQATNDGVYVLADQSVYKLSTDDGSTQWTVDMSAEFPDDDYVRIETMVVGDGVFLATEDGVYAYETDTGARRWSYDIEATDLAVADGTLYHFDTLGNLSALSVSTGEKRWGTNNRTKSYVVREDSLVLQTSSGVLTKVDAESGERLWNWDPELGSDVDSRSHLVGAGDALGLVIRHEDGDTNWKSLALLDPENRDTRVYHLTESVEEPYPNYTAPVIADGTAYVAAGGGNDDDSDDALYAVSLFGSKPDESENRAPSARIDSEAEGCGDSYALDGSASADPDGSVVKYEWDVGADGTVDDTGETTTVTVADGESVSVRLTVIDDDGATASTTIEL
ncbi:outer membrane protein assembly factor BamB family protein [Halorussus halophilus]|uniref:outer membrane protein assembly factor BamB family protein n=1 Tax=Halorussus halophilus TaxID=2650975 RepID=UPI001300FE28|nr:PQQ-binding-like beta-propeller repeat protein [Halorussus halophilus]